MTIPHPLPPRQTHTHKTPQHSTTTHPHMCRGRRARRAGGTRSRCPTRRRRPSPPSPRRRGRRSVVVCVGGGVLVYVCIYMGKNRVDDLCGVGGGGRGGMVVLFFSCMYGVYTFSCDILKKKHTHITHIYRHT